MPTRLKSLELQGYKTFASKTLFEFPGDITAIVGPNGAGKSNVSDAIRWVLGEQAYSLLRGRKTEDMIFSGSEHRPRASMAMATIHFDNEDNWLPIDYSEVAITRRAYRDGQNEYLINSQKVRLKETSEILARSGLAERTYTIIGQGLVDAALSLKPEDRRQFFEEAAGIGLYRSRRDEAIKRLENTKRNLERVQDILSEIEPRLKSLERQALRAKEYSRVKTDLDVLLRDWYGYHWHQAQQALSQAREKQNVQKQRLDSQNLIQKEVEQALELTQNRIKDIRNSLSGWHAESSRIHAEREKVSRAIAILDERNRSLNSQKHSLESEKIRIDEEIKDKKLRSDSVDDEEQRLDEEVKTIENQISNAQKVYDEKQKERTLVEDEYKQVQDRFKDNENKKLEESVRLRELNARSIEVKNSIISAEENVKKSDELISDNQKELEKNRNDFELIKTKIDTYTTEKSTLVTNGIALEEKNNKISKDLTNKDAEINKLSTQLELIEQAERTFSGINQGSKSILEAVGSGRLSGNYRLISQYIDVPEELDLAITAALGDCFNGLLIDSNTKYDDALSLLSQTEKGRTTFILEAQLKENKHVSLPNQEGVIGIASELINSDDEHLKIFKSLLSDVLIVNDRQTARNVIDSYKNIPVVVTRQGEIFKQNGIIIAGKDGKELALKRNRTKRDLTSTLASINQVKHNIEKELQKIQDEILKNKGEETSVSNKINEVSVQLNNIEKEYQSLVIAKEQVTNRKNLLVENLKNQRSQLSNIEQDVVGIQEKIENFESQKDVISTKLENIQEKLIQTSLDELKDEISSLNTNYAVVKRALNDIKSRKLDIQRSIETDEVQLTNILKRMADTEQLIKQIDEEKITNKKSEEDYSKEINLIREKIHPANDELQKLEKDLLDLQERQKISQQTLNSIERYYTQAQLDVTYQRDSLDDLRKKIQDDLGLVDFQYTSKISGPSPLPLKELVEELPILSEIPVDIEADINRQKSIIRRLGPINPDIEEEYQEVKERHEYLITQTEDLTKADEDLRQVISELDELMTAEFISTFNQVAAEFKKLFTILFGGGSARLILNEADDPTKMGIDIEAKLPGRREQDLSLLSGGERSLTAVALIFSLLRVSPTPFCVMDEVEAMLDEANVGRFCELLKELSQHTQFIIITHNRNTVQIADVIYGVTMGKDSASQIISLRIDELGEDMVR